MPNRILQGIFLFCLEVALAFPAWPASKAKIVLQESPLAGFQFYQGKALWAEMKVGDRLELIREPDNPYDPRAIRIEWQGQKLGYVPRRENADIARLMDKGIKLEARITRLTESRDPWQRLRFEILVPLE